MLHGTVGRLLKADHLDRAERYLQTRGGRAVFLGRFTAALRVLVPGMAGMSGLPYRKFLAWNAAGGVVWATAFVLAGYLAGDSWRHIEHVAGRASIVLALLLAVTAGVVLAARWAARHQERFRSVMATQLERPSVARLRTRYRREIDFLSRRLQPGGALGLSLTASLAALVVVGWGLGAVVQDVAIGDGSIRFDLPVLRWFARHREPWLTTAMRTVTLLGSSAVLVARRCGRSPPGPALRPSSPWGTSSGTPSRRATPPRPPPSTACWPSSWPPAPAGGGARSPPGPPPC
jgi:undecaprenyl-diphosphatase